MLACTDSASFLCRPSLPAGIDPRCQHGLYDALSPAYVSDFLATSDGLALVKAFMWIKNPTVRDSIVTLVKQIAGECE